MPKRATAMMAVVAVIIHCVLGCCARCLSAEEHHGQAEQCSASCLCCDHHHHDSDIQLCCQPATSFLPEQAAAEETPHSDHHECLGCGTAKCAFILQESACDGLTDALLLPVDLCWTDTSCPLLTCPAQPAPTGPPRRTLSSMTPKVRLHLSLAVLTL